MAKDVAKESKDAGRPLKQSGGTQGENESPLLLRDASYIVGAVQVCGSLA